MQKGQNSKLTLLKEGSNSQIYRCGSEGKSVVLKIVSATCSKQSSHLKNQYILLSEINHENIVRVYKYKQSVIDSCTTQHKIGVPTNVLVMQNAQHGSLLDFYKKCHPNVKQIRWIMAQLGEAIRYLHCNYIVHRDLKLDNVLVCQNDSRIQIKLSDFGFATKTTNSRHSNGFKGTPRYMAPEILAAGKNIQVNYDMYKTDIFCLGVILFALVLGRMPFDMALPTDRHYSCIYKRDYEQFWNLHAQVTDKANLPDSMLEDFKQIFQQMIDVDPLKRPTIQQFLESPWVSGKQQIMKSFKVTKETL